MFPVVPYTIIFTIILLVIWITTPLVCKILFGKFKFYSSYQERDLSHAVLICRLLLLVAFASVSVVIGILTKDNITEIAPQFRPIILIAHLFFFPIIFIMTALFTEPNTFLLGFVGYLLIYLILSVGGMLMIKKIRFSDAAKLSFSIFATFFVMLFVISFGLSWGLSMIGNL